MLSLIESVMPMTMDLYRQSDLQNSDTGEIKKEWQYINTVACHAKGIISNSTSSRTNDRQIIGNKYSIDQLIQVRTMDRLMPNYKVTNIKDSSGQVIWKEINYPTETPTVFEVVGTTPMMDALGKIIGYSSNLKRSENQTIGL